MTLDRVQGDLLVGMGPPPARPRLIGAVWGLGFLWFGCARRIPPGWAPRLLGLGVLGGLQGAIGWWMVALRPRRGMDAVASYRLAIHLGLAFVILGLIAWYVLRLGRPEAELLQARRQRNDGAGRLGHGARRRRLRADRCSGRWSPASTPGATTPTGR